MTHARDNYWGVKFQRKLLTAGMDTSRISGCTRKAND